MKLISRTLAVLAAAMVVVAFWLAVDSLSGSTGTLAARMGGHAMERGFHLAGIVEILPTLAIVAIVTAIIAPIKQRLLNKRRPSAPARGPQVATPAAYHGHCDKGVRVLLSDMVDNSLLPFWPDSGSFLPHPASLTTVRPPVWPALVSTRPLRADWSPAPYNQTAPIGSGGSGNVSSSCTVQRRLVSPAAIAGVRCR